MSSFSTEFPINTKNTVADVLRLACEWITGSPHTKITEADLLELPNCAERTVTVGMEQATLAHSRTTRASPRKSNTDPTVMHREAMDHGMF